MEISATEVIVSILKILLAIIIFSIVAWNLWVSYINTIFLKSIKWTLFELKPPKDVFKSPLAMELVLQALYQTGGTGNWYDKFWKGQLRMWFSLEIVSLEGKIHFYIRTPEKFRKLIESQVYAQYPQAELSEVPDYASIFPDYTKDAYGIWGCTFKLKKDDPYPIKTYIDYGLDRAVGALEEEQRIDPITPMLEYMGSMGSQEYVWFQILVRADTERFSITKDGKVTMGSWKDKAKELATKLREELQPKKKEGEPFAMMAPTTKGQLGVIESIERSIQKHGFDCGFRAIYLTKDGAAFDANRIPGLTGMLRAFDNGELNSFGVDTKTAFDLPWQDPLGNRTVKLRKEFMEAYKARGYFYGGFDFSDIKTYFTHHAKSGATPYILNTEELATIFHLPGRVAETPTFTRIEATKAEPPSNLPI